MKNKYVFIIITALITAAGLFATYVSNKTELAMNDHNYVTPVGGVYGETKYEMTFENAVNKLSSDVILGEVIDSSQYADNYNMLNIKVEDVLVGNVKSEMIKVYANKLSLEPGSRYILFLRRHDSALYEYPFYVLLNEFVLKVDHNGQVMLLENPEEKIFIKPFKDDKYNNMDNLRKYIMTIKKHNIFANKEE